MAEDSQSGVELSFWPCPEQHSPPQLSLESFYSFSDYSYSSYSSSCPTPPPSTTDTPPTTTTDTPTLSPTTDSPTPPPSTTDTPPTTTTDTPSTLSPTTDSPTPPPSTTDTPPTTTTDTPSTLSPTTDSPTPPPSTTDTPPTTTTDTPSTLSPTTDSPTPPPSTTDTPPTTTTDTPSTLSPTTNSPTPPLNTTDTPTPTSTDTPSTPPPTTTGTLSTTPTPTTTSATTTAPPTTAPLVCENGGIPLQGVCLCPDEWTGETCSQAGKPQATTRCVNKNGSPIFERAQEFKCEQTLSDLQQNLTSPADLESLATSTQILTSNPEELTAENITAAVQITNTLLLSPNATESVRVAAVATVSQLLSASTPDDRVENNATLRLTVTLDELSVNLSLTLNTPESQVVQPNLVVQSAQVPAADTQGVQFMSLSGTSGSFVAERIKLNTNTSSVVVDNGGIADALIYVRFPPDAVGARQKPSNVSLGFVLYQNDRFFQSRRYKSKRSTIRVLSGSVSGQERSVVPQHVEMAFRPITVNGASLYDFACVFWNYSLEEWSTDGCSKGNASDGLLRCFCNHTTNFAALWSFRENYEYAEALDWISTVGLSVSILGLVVTIIHHIKENFYRSSRDRQNNKNSKITLLCIYVSLLAFIITFLSGVGNSSRQNDAPVKVDAPINSIPESDERVEPDGGSCTAVAALLHFFLLATFMWNSVYGTQLVLLFRSMRRSLPPHWTKLSLAVGWGVPAVVMAITLGATYRVGNPLGYRQEEFCWLAALDQAKQFHFEKPMFWGFILPVGLILIYNIVLLVLASLTTCRTDQTIKSTNQLSLTKKFLISFSLAVLLGLSWTLGYLVLVTSGHAHLAFSIVFCLCTTTQGFQIFILFTVRTPSFRTAVSRSVTSVNIQLHNRAYHLWKRSRGTTSSESYRDLRDRPTSDTKTLSQM
ncbi:adhesion G-protein coupled receptor G7-like [Symphorus nematophorus]